MITHRTGNLFSAPIGSILIHSCNAQGVWGAGVALQVKNRYWEAYRDFRKWLQTFMGRSGNPLGNTRLFNRHATSHSVASMVVSHGFGSSVDPPEAILVRTAEAIHHLLIQEMAAAVRQKRLLREFHSPRINAGLFNVPWERTEAVIRERLSSFNDGRPFHGHEGRPFHWTVWTP